MLIKNVMARIGILADDLLFNLVSLFLILEGHLHETEASATHCGLVPHYDLIKNLSELGEVGVQVIF